MKKTLFLITGLLLILSLLPVCSLGESAPAAASEPIFILPDGYAIGDPLPIYVAERGNYTRRIDPAWLTSSPIQDREEHFNGLVNVCTTTFEHGEWLSTCESNMNYYRQYDTETYETGMSGKVYDFVRGEDDLPLIHTSLAGITCDAAVAMGGELLRKISGVEWMLDQAVDMDVARIRELGEKDNNRWSVWHEPVDLSVVTEADEAYYLSYSYLVDGLRAYVDYTFFRADILVNARGIERFNVLTAYLRGEQFAAPDRLLTPQEIMEILPKEMRKYRFGGKLHSVISLELIYSVQEDASSPTGYLMVPAWYILYRDNGAAKQGYTCQAVFSAVDGAMLQSMFDEKGGG